METFTISHLVILNTINDDHILDLAGLIVIIVIVLQLEFMRGLVQLAVEKLHSELPHLQFDDTLFSHTVDETLGFDRELRDSYGYPPSQPSIIGVLTQAQIFVKWIHMEKKCELSAETSSK